MMTETTQLKGMTWSDPRGYDPVVAAAEAFAKIRPGISIAWDKRSLQGFETTPVDELATRYDLMVIDHPHVGSVADQGCLLPFETHANEDAVAELANQSVGRSFQSYFLHGRQWALPIDAAAQVQAHRADLSPRVDHWADVIRKAEDGLVIWPLRPPHVLMSFFTLAANLGHPCATSFGDLIDATTGLKVLAAMCAVSRHMDEAFYTMDPIAVLDELAQSGRYHLAPLVYLYKGYANEGYRSNRIHFTDMPVLGRKRPPGLGTWRNRHSDFRQHRAPGTLHRICPLACRCRMPVRSLRQGQRPAGQCTGLEQRRGQCARIGRILQHKTDPRDRLAAAAP
jgi:multiple sugar transport system substrate-binding protein